MARLRTTTRWRLSATLTTASIGFFFAALPAAAQTTPSEPPAAGYLSGGLLVSMQPAGKSDCPYLCDPFGGVAGGLVVAVGGSVGEHLTVGGELSRTGTLNGSQRARAICEGPLLCETVHRDTIGSLVLRFSPAGAGDPVRLMVVGGGGVAFRQTTRTSETSGQEKLNDVVPALVGGVDVPIRVGRRTAVLASARGHFLLDSDRTEDGTVKRGVSSFVFRAGAALELRF